MTAFIAYLLPGILWTLAALAGWAAVSGLFVGAWSLAVRWHSRGAR